ncbi:MAG: NHL repeat-containing protein [Planctomycetota bacterium]|jgi:DNA-binding beta-propeller fold protein YncE
MKLTTGRPAAKAGLLLVLGLAVFFSTAQGRTDSNAAGSRINVRTTGVIVGPEGESFSMPSDAAVGPDGDLYVLDGVNHRVVVYDAAGKFRFEFGSRGSGLGQLLFPLGITTAPDGKVYVADSGNHRFQVFSADGSPLKVVPLPNITSGVPPDPTDLTVDAVREQLYVVDNDNHKLHVYNLSNNSFEQVWGGPGQGRRQFRFPFFIDTSGSGYVFVVEPINTRVQVLNSSGKFVCFIGAWGVKPGQLFRPKGIVTFEDRVFVTDSYLGRIQIFNMGGDFLCMLTDSEGAPVQLTTPTGITIDAKRRRLYVVELNADRVCWMDLE